MWPGDLAPKWELYQDLLKGQQIKVLELNDVAKRVVKLIDEYEKFLMKQDVQRQLIIMQTVSVNRNILKNVKQSTINMCLEFDENPMKDIIQSNELFCFHHSSQNLKFLLSCDSYSCKNRSTLHKKIKLT